MSEHVEFRSNGSKASGYLAKPAGGRGPGVLVIQEWWGLVRHIEDVCDRFAADGFVALAPDLFRGETASEPDEAGKLMMALDIIKGGDRHTHDPALRDDILDSLERCLPDQVNAWELDPDGEWTHREVDPSEPRDVHRELMLGHSARRRGRDHRVSDEPSSTESRRRSGQR